MAAPFGFESVFARDQPVLQLELLNNLEPRAKAFAMNRVQAICGDALLPIDAYQVVMRGYDYDPRFGPAYRVHFDVGMKPLSEHESTHGMPQLPDKVRDSDHVVELVTFWGAIKKTTLRIPWLGAIHVDTKRSNFHCQIREPKSSSCMLPMKWTGTPLSEWKKDVMSLCIDSSALMRMAMTSLQLSNISTQQKLLLTHLSRIIPRRDRA